MRVQFHGVTIRFSGDSDCRLTSILSMHQSRTTSRQGRPASGPPPAPSRVRSRHMRRERGARQIGAVVLFAQMRRWPMIMPQPAEIKAAEKSRGLVVERCPWAPAMRALSDGG